MHLASVPYALKAADTETLGGKPASAYLLAEPQKTPHASKNPTDAASPATAGTTGYVGVFVDTANLGNSALYQTGATIGLGTTVPRDTFHVSFTDGGGGFTGYAVQNLSGAVNAYSGMLFYDQTGATAQFQGFNNATHEYRINNVATGGTINFMIGSSSKFLVANNGNIGVGVAAPASKAGRGGRHQHDDPVQHRRQPGAQRAWASEHIRGRRCRATHHGQQELVLRVECRIRQLGHFQLLLRTSRWKPQLGQR